MQSLHSVDSEPEFLDSPFPYGMYLESRNRTVAARPKDEWIIQAPEEIIQEAKRSVQGMAWVGGLV